MMAVRLAGSIRPHRGRSGPRLSIRGRIAAAAIVGAVGGFILGVLVVFVGSLYVGALI